MEILQFEDLGDTKFESNRTITQGGIYPHINFERDPRAAADADTDAAMAAMLKP